ncbi:MAG: toll/interleukin-1 receptor domain-containing protein [Phycisphaeraceae bacterium]|nr:toll/interleukin-1 receptor domain-containing protein [Phycisphaeraceae bacterium]
MTDCKETAHGDGTAKDFVFISHSRRDRAFVDRLVRVLRRGGIATWPDTNELAPGENWHLAIEAGIRQSAAFLFMASAESINSQWISTELKAVFGKGTCVIPVVLDNEGKHGLPSFLPSFLRDCEWVEFRTGTRRLLTNSSGLSCRFAPSLRSNQEPVKPKATSSSAMLSMMLHSWIDSRSS